LLIGCGLVDGYCTDIMSRTKRKGVVKRKNCHLLHDTLKMKVEDAS
jgi:hypothetical protein